LVEFNVVGADTDNGVKDYKIAMDNEIPERWWRVQQKLM